MCQRLAKWVKVSVITQGCQWTTNSKEQNPSRGANSRSAGQGIPRLYGHHTNKPYLPKIHFIIILPSTPSSSKWLHPSGFPTKILCSFLTSPCLIQAPPMSFLIILTTNYLTKNANYGAHNKQFSTPSMFFP